MPHISTDTRVMERTTSLLGVEDTAYQADAALGEKHSILEVLHADCFDQLSDRVCLKLCNMRMAALPPEFCLHLTALRELNLAQSDLVALPQGFSGLTNLRTLTLESNMLRSLPEDFGHLKELQFLDVGFNFLTKLPDSFGDLVALIEVHLQGNKLEALPDSFGKLSCLQYLYLTENFLKQIPHTFVNLQSLRRVALRNNCLTSVAGSLRSLQDLEDLDLRGNTLNAADAVTLLKLAELNRWASLRTSPGTRLKRALLSSAMADPYTVCSCGQRFDPQANFCMNCGEERINRLAGVGARSANASSGLLGGFIARLSGQLQAGMSIGLCGKVGHSVRRRFTTPLPEELCNLCNSHRPRYFCSAGCNFQVCIKCFEADTPAAQAAAQATTTQQMESVTVGPLLT